MSDFFIYPHITLMNHTTHIKILHSLLISIFNRNDDADYKVSFVWYASKSRIIKRKTYHIIAICYHIMAYRHLTIVSVCRFVCMFIFRIHTMRMFDFILKYKFQCKNIITKMYDRKDK